MSEWIPLSERKPTREDANKHGRVLALFADGDSATIEWDSKLNSWTHWAPLPSLPEPPPPPKPAMPERIEFVKCKPGEKCNDGSIGLNVDGQAIDVASGLTSEDLRSDYTLYRRVPPTKRIVWEVGGENRIANRGEWALANDQPDLGPVCFVHGTREPVTILRLVEGQEYLR